MRKTSDEQAHSSLSLSCGATPGVVAVGLGSAVAADFVEATGLSLSWPDAAFFGACGARADCWLVEVLGSAFLSGGSERRAALKGAALRGGKVVSFLLGAGMAMPLGMGYGFLALLVPAAFVLVATGLSFMPDWSPSDFPYHAREGARTSEKPETSVAGVR